MNERDLFRANGIDPDAIDATPIPAGANPPAADVAEVSVVDETPDHGRAWAPPPGDATPGYCSEHPDLELVRPRRLNRFDRRPWPIACPSRDHTHYDRDRCMYCGRALFVADRLEDGSMALTPYNALKHLCNATCRNYLWRVEYRRLRAEAVAAGKRPPVKKTSPLASQAAVRARMAAGRR